MIGNHRKKGVEIAPIMDTSNETVNAFQRMIINRRRDKKACFRKTFTENQGKGEPPKGFNSGKKDFPGEIVGALQTMIRRRPERV